ncbi:MAG: D-isomer specific 2-hydroxyacid dehydrogenase NAD-binding protein [Parcubacteria group bacterium GW2011_GWC1_35_8]|nr:MAG: D-isomer specific 2-hydroxyacid dehydrogenase NAD-binding protein [Parcubacteria group bacterium GW2011_GWC1_35_8]
MKIVFFEIFNEIQDKEKKALEKLFPNDEVSFFIERLSEENVNSVKDAEIVSVFTNSSVNKKVIDSLPKLKFINTSSTGFEHIDTDYCARKGIKVSNVPAYGSVTVAEFVFALLLNLSRKVEKANNQLRQEDNFNIDALRGFDLKGKILGVIGTGKIGKNVIKIARGFGMNVIAYDLYPDLVFAKENNFEYKSFVEVISNSDVITLHTPYTKENHHLINKENIIKMKEGVYLINTARGALIDTESLLWGLKKGIIAGAGLDVLEDERNLKEEIKILTSGKINAIKNYKTLLQDHALIDMPQVIVTPHIAFYSKEAEEEIMKVTVSNIAGFISNNPINLVK